MDINRITPDIIEFNKLVAENITKIPVYSGVGTVVDANMATYKTVRIPKVKYSLSKENGVILNDTSEFAKINTEFDFERVKLVEQVFEEEYTDQELMLFDYFAPQQMAQKVEIVQQYCDYINRTGMTPLGHKITKGVEDNAEIITTTFVDDAVAYFNAVKKQYHKLQDRFGTPETGARGYYTVILPLNFGENFGIVGDNAMDGEVWFNQMLSNLGIGTKLDSELTGSFLLIRNDYLNVYSEKEVLAWWSWKEGIGSPRPRNFRGIGGATKWFDNKIAGKNAVIKVNYTFTRQFKEVETNTEVVNLASAEIARERNRNRNKND